MTGDRWARAATPTEARAAVEPGRKLGRYTLGELIGRGGMGEVYRAHDPRLGRDIAIKILPPEVAGDAERLRRFEQEARAVAALNHPSIVTIHSVEQAGDLHFLTMELVEGKPLAALIPRHGLPLDRLLDLAVPLADAVGAAHARGIVHRDLKPANLMVTPEGRIKVLDFGLAKLRPVASLSELSTEIAPQRTANGQMLGTVYYMSPEQAEGREVDQRSDLFSLGVMFFELATGHRPFTGDTTVSLLSSLLKDTPPAVTDLRPELPRELAQIVRRCLAKDVGRRYQSAIDLRNELEEVKQEVASGSLGAARRWSRTIPRSQWSGGAAIGAGLVLLAAGGYFLVSLLRSSPSRGSPVPSFTKLTSEQGGEDHPSISPDGKWIVYDSDARGKYVIYLRSVGEQTAIPLTKDTDDDFQPAFSPDGKRIAFSRPSGGIWVMGLTGDSPRPLTNVGYSPAWSPDGNHIVYATDYTTQALVRGGPSELWVVQVDTGEATRLLASDGVNPTWSPNGRFVAFWGGLKNPESGTRDIGIVPIQGGAVIAITDDAAVDWSPAWADGGRLLYFASDRGGSMNLWRVAIDPGSGQRRGEPEPVTTPASYLGGLSMSADGRRLVFANTVARSHVYRVGFDPVSGSVRGDSLPVTSGSSYWAYFDVYGDRVVLSRAFYEREDLFTCRIDGSDMFRLTNDEFYDRRPKWSPDGKVIAFYSNRSDKWEIWTVAPDASNLRQVTRATAYSALSPVWRPDGTKMVFSDIGPRHEVVAFDPRKPWSEQTPESLPAPPKPDFHPTSWSPDGWRIAGPQNDTPLAVYDFRSRKYERLVEGVVDAVGTDWLGNDRILYSVHGKLVLFDLRRRFATEVLSVPPPEGVGAPRLSADGRTLFFLRGSIESDIWMMEVK